MTPDYEGVEDMALFPDRASLQAYREMLIRKTKPQAVFIQKHVVSRLKHLLCAERKLYITEVGSGNGRLLIALAGWGMLEQGMGFDISESRTMFATQWARSVGVGDLVSFYREDARYEYLGDSDLDVCITGCANYFDASDLRRLLCRLGGHFGLFELYKPPAQNKFWYELAPEDPFQYYLNEYIECITPPNALLHNKIFVGRDGRVDYRSEVLHYYSMGEFLDMCFAAGYKKIHWAVEDSTKFVVLVE